MGSEQEVGNLCFQGKFGLVELGIEWGSRFEGVELCFMVLAYAESSAFLGIHFCAAPRCPFV